MADPQDSPTEEAIPTPPQVPPPAPAAAGMPEAPRERSGAIWLVLGGLVAAGLGFGLSRVVPGGWPIGGSSALQAQVEALVADNAALKARVMDLAERPMSDPALMERIAALESRPATPETSAELADLKAQVQALANAPARPGGDAAALKALQDQVAALSAAAAPALDVAAIDAAVSAAVETAQGQMAATVASAEAAAAKLTADAAMTRIAAALESGAPYAAALTDLGRDTIPAVLTDHAASGVPTLQSLREAFPPAARSALEAARQSDLGSSWTDRIAAFLEVQTGARSLTPREGNDPDAILSRAEAALDGGDVAGALTELAALPDAAKPALADWVAQAQVRLDAAAALGDLAKAGG